MGKYLTEITKQNATLVYGNQAGVDVPNVTLNSDGITYTDNDECIIAYTFTWYDKFIELDEGTTRTWEFALYDDPTDGKTKYVLIDPFNKHIHLLANGESFVWTVKISKATLEDSNYTFNAYKALPTNGLPSFIFTRYVDYYIPGINDGCYTWESNVEYCMTHAATLGITSDQAEFDLLDYNTRYNQAKNWLMQRSGSNFYAACLVYASTPEDQELYCKICQAGTWHSTGTDNIINQNYRNTELVSCINFITSNIESIRVNNIATYRNCSKLIFNDNIKTLNGFNAASAYFSYIHLPKHLKNFENTENGSFSYAKGGGVADGHDDPSLFIDFGDDLESIPASMFNNGEGIKISMKLPKALKDIGPGAFMWFNTDEQLVIPASVETIGTNSNYPNIVFSPMIIQKGDAIEGEENYIITKIPSVKFEGTTPPAFAKVASNNTPSGYWQDFAYIYDENNVTITENSYHQLRYTAPLIKASYPIYVPRGSKAAYMAALDLCEESRFIEYDHE